jgi:hypothetical protein
VAHTQTPALTPGMVRTFHVDDSSAVYALYLDRDGVLLIRGLNTHVVYTSTDNAVEVTGRERRQTGGLWGSRAVLTLDTGEHLTVLRGVLDESRAHGYPI